jgi:hypothetical protein
MDTQLSPAALGTHSPIVHECHHTGAGCTCATEHPGYDRRANLLWLLDSIRRQAPHVERLTSEPVRLTHAEAQTLLDHATALAALTLGRV